MLDIITEWPGPPLLAAFAISILVAFTWEILAGGK